MREALGIDPERETARIVEAIRRDVLGTLRRKGAVIGLSGGVDSSVVAALCVRALGPERVLGIMMPEKDCSAESSSLARALVKALGIEARVEDIGPALEALGCYRRQTDAIRSVFPEYGDGWRCKLSLPPITENARLNVFTLTVESPQGKQRTARLSLRAYLALVAATNFKQRVRASMLYHHADCLAYAVAGTPNRLEFDQGFFVKQGDGAADFKPIAHLYKTQVYALAEHLGVPDEIRKRPPTTDTFSIPQTQEEFFFALPIEQLDLCLWAYNHHVSSAEVASALGRTPAQIERVYNDIASKRRATHYLHLSPLLVEPVGEN